MDAKPVKLTIRVEDRYLNKLTSVANDLRNCGMAVERCDEATGTIVGKIPPEKMDNIRSVPGISSCER